MGTTEFSNFLAASERIEVIVSTVVIPRETRAGVASTAIQNETQLLSISWKFLSCQY